MKEAYIVTENNNAALLIKKLLPKEINHLVNYLPRTDYNWAQSTASVLVTTKRSPVILVLDADSVDTQTISDRRLVNEELLGFSAITRFQVILAVPEIEILLFQNRAVLEELLDCEISDMDWVRAEFIPRTILQKLLAANSPTATLEQLLDRLTPPMLAKLQNHPLLQEVTEFLVRVSDTQLVPV
jgi:hypothetical protein